MRAPHDGTARRRFLLRAFRDCRRTARPCMAGRPMRRGHVMMLRPGRHTARRSRAGTSRGDAGEGTVGRGRPSLRLSDAMSSSAGRAGSAAATMPMSALPNGGLIRTSAKSHWETPAHPQEGDPARGRSALKYPARSVDPRRFPRHRRAQRPDPLSVEFAPRGFRHGHRGGRPLARLDGCDAARGARSLSFPAQRHASCRCRCSGTPMAGAIMRPGRDAIRLPRR